MHNHNAQKSFITRLLEHLLLPLALMSACLILSSCSKTIYSHYALQLNPQRLQAVQQLETFQKDIKRMDNIIILGNGINNPRIENLPIMNTLFSVEPNKNKYLPARYAKKQGIRIVITIPPDGCDEILLYNGASLKAKVLEITTDEIKYKKCANQNGPTYSIKKNEVQQINYVDGTTDKFSGEKSSNTQDNQQISQERHSTRSVDVVSLVGFCLSLLGIIFLFVLTLSFAGLFLAFIFGLAAIIMGGIGIGRVNNNPNELMGKGFAITSLILGIILLLLTLISTVGLLILLRVI